MPITTNSSAVPAKIVSAMVLKSVLAVDLDITSSIVRIGANARPPLTSLSSFSIAEMSECGSTRVRTTQVMAELRETNALRLSGS